MTAFNDRIAFCHVPKTAGHSCREFMAEHLTGVQDLERMYERPPHLALRDWPAWIGREPASFERIIVVIRNPYEHQVSQWLFWKSRYARGYRMDPCVHAGLSADMGQWLSGPLADWHVYDPRPTNGVQRTVAEMYRGYEAFGGYYPYWLFVNGTLPDNVRFVRFEHLATAFPKAIGCSGEMPRSNVGPGTRDVREYYHDPRTLDVVERKFAWLFKEGFYKRMQR